MATRKLDATQNQSKPILSLLFTLILLYLIFTYYIYCYTHRETFTSQFYMQLIFANFLFIKIVIIFLEMHLDGAVFSIGISFFDKLYTL